MTSDLVFYKVQDIMDEYGYLADPEVVDKHIEFVSLCKFAGYEDLRTGSLIQKPIPNEVVLEIVKQKRPPLKWTANSLEEAIRVEKEFNRILLKHYDGSRHSFLKRND